MKKNKNGKAGIIVWGSVSAGVVALLATVTILTTSTFRPILSTVLGGKKPVMAPGVEQIYTSDYKSKKESKLAGDELNKQIATEGFTLLKNENNALPLGQKERKISVFGKNSVNLVLGGSGSGGISGDSATTIYDGFKEAGLEVNPTLKEFYEDDKLSGTGRSNSPALSDTSSSSPTLDIGETPAEMYTTDAKNSFSQYNDAAVVVISRMGGESWDLPRTQNTNNGGIEGRHYLQLDNNEYAMLDMATANFKKVIVVLNTLTSFQCDFLEEYNNDPTNPRIDAVVWIGGPGSTGAGVLGKLLTGEENFSGRTVDLYAKDFTKNPTFVNFGDNSQVGSTTAYRDGAIDDAQTFVSYNEGIYMGYRYYETRGYEESKSDLNINWYDQNVIFPFGYGLSYSQFSQSMSASGSLTDKDSQLTFDVDVTKIGGLDGKDVVQLYVTLPYTSGGIEKSHVQLVDFAKTDVLTDANKTGHVQFKVDAYDLASYDYNDANDNGFAGYELEKGEYSFYIAKNSHVDDSNNVYATAKFYLDNTIEFDKDTTTGTEVKNLYTFGENYDGKDKDGKVNFDDLQYRLKDHYVTNLDGEEVYRKGMSRSNFSQTFPTPLTAEDRTYLEGEKDAIKSFNHNNTDISSATMPTMDADVTVTLRDLIGKDYDDLTWEKLLDSLTFEEMVKLVNDGAFETLSITKIKKNLTNDSDGPIGFVNFMPGLSSHYKDTTTFACEILIGATWNKDLAYQMGRAVGDNGVWGDEDGNHLPYTGWYAPAVNLHRSPFAGRNFEYYSEDPILSGKFAVNVINGAKSKGVYTDLKHFALNDQETNRAGIATFVTEQALREIYLKPFELAVKGKDSPTFSAAATADGISSYSGTTGVMSSFNRIGTKWTGGDYRLMTKILRDEWGYHGLVICDYKTDNSVMDSRQMLYAGNDLILASLDNLLWNDASATSAQDVTVLRQAAHNILYTVANSNSMNVDIVGYHLEWWVTTIIVTDAVLATALITWGVLVFVLYNKRKKTILTEKTSE